MRYDLRDYFVKELYKQSIEAGKKFSKQRIAQILEQEGFKKISHERVRQILEHE